MFSFLFLLLYFLSTSQQLQKQTGLLKASKKKNIIGAVVYIRTIFRLIFFFSNVTIDDLSAFLNYFTSAKTLFEMKVL